MTELPIPVPPGWEAAVGWTGGGEARWLSGFWTSLGDHPQLSDGRSSMSGDGYGWLAWSRHPKVAPQLRPYDLGCSLQEGPHALLIDRAERKAYAAERAEADRVVRGQWPVADEEDLTREEADQVATEVAREWMSMPMPTAERLMASLRERATRVAAMVAWLDEWSLEGKR